MSEPGRQVEPVGKVLVWMWEYGTLDVTPFDSLRAALTYVRDTQDAGAGALESIEGDFSPADRAAAEAELDAEREREAEEAMARRVQVAWRVDVRAPRLKTDRKAFVAATVTREEADEEAAKWAAVVGAERVSVSKLR